MRLVSFGAAGGERLGALVEGGKRIVDLNAADNAIPSSMIDFLRGDFWEKSKRLLADTSSLAGKAVVDVEKQCALLFVSFNFANAIR